MRSTAEGGCVHGAVGRRDAGGSDVLRQSLESAFNFGNRGEAVAFANGDAARA